MNATHDSLPREQDSIRKESHNARNSLKLAYVVLPQMTPIYPHSCLRFKGKPANLNLSSQRKK